MSADHWGERPKCKEKAQAEYEDRQRAMVGGYGKVPAEEYRRLTLEAARPVETNETWREDYEIGLYKDGTFCVDYAGGCEVCGAHFEYKYSQEVKL